MQPGMETKRVGDCNGKNKTYIINALRKKIIHLFGMINQSTTTN